MAIDLSIILVHTESNGNIGSVARIMKNFNYKKLVLFNPEEDPHSNYAYGFAMKAGDVLKNCQIIRCDENEEYISFKKILEEYDLAIGTSGKGISHNNIKRVPIILNELDFSKLDKNAKIALVFGRESTGLSNKELMLMDFIIRIPSNPEYTILNLSHAVGVILYHLYTLENKELDEKLARMVSPAKKFDKYIMLETFMEIVNHLPLGNEVQKTRIIHAFKNVVGRAFISKKENHLILKFFKALKYKN